MRTPLVAGLLLLSAGVGAQTGTYEAIRKAIADAQASGKLPLAWQGNPMQRRPGAVLSQRLPEPDDVPGEFRLIRGGDIRREGQRIFLKGGTEFVFRGYQAIADMAEGDLRSEVFTLSGNVTLTGKNAAVVGERIEVNFRQRTFAAWNAETTVQPQMAGGGLQSPLYANGERIFGTNAQLFLDTCDVTTCSLKEPHFHLRAKSADVVPGNRAILRNVSVNVLGSTLFTLPYLLIPLDERTYRYLPEVGYSSDEGYFIKARYGIPLRGGQDDLITRLDLMSKLGIGVGLDWTYNTPGFDGTLRGYNLFGDQQTTTANVDHRQRIGPGTLSIAADYQRDNYLTAPESTLLGIRSQYAVSSRTASTRVGFVRTLNDSDSFRSDFQTLSFADSRNWTNFRTQIDATYSQTESVFGTNTTLREQMDLRARSNWDLKKAELQFDYQRQIPVGESPSVLGATDRTPVISLQTDARRLLPGRSAGALPFRAEVSIGEFGNPGSEGRIGRGTIDLSLPRIGSTSGAFRTDSSALFKQQIYSDDTAQYVLGFNTNLSYGFGRQSSVSLRYNYLRPYGYSPLAIDRSGQTNLASLSIDYSPGPAWTAGFQTTYDINRLEFGDTPWQQVGIRAEYRPTKRFFTRSFLTYDTFQRAWSNLRVDSAYQTGETFLSLGARYDGIRHTWSNVNFFMDNLVSGKFRLSSLFSYNGSLNRIEAQQHSLIYDMHCSEAILTYTDTGFGFRSGQSIGFFIRLKALPFDSAFGVGTRGQPLGTGTGRDF